MDSIIDADEYMDIVTVYRCKFCDFSADHPKRIGHHVKTVHIKPTTIIVASSDQGTDQGTAVSNHITSTPSPNVTVLHNPSSELTETIRNVDSDTVTDDVVSRAVEESNLQIQKEAENENEALDDPGGPTSLDSLMVGGTNDVQGQLNPILTYHKTGGEGNSQIVGYYSKGQIFTSLAPYQEGQTVVVGEQVEGQLYGNSMQVMDHNSSQVALNFVENNSGALTIERTEEKTQSDQNSEVQILVSGTDIQTDGLSETAVNTDVCSENSEVKYVIQDSVTQTYETGHTDAVSGNRDIDSNQIENSLTQETGNANTDAKNMHIIIENSDNASVHRISVDSETLKKTLVSSGTDARGSQNEDIMTVMPQTHSNSIQSDDSSVTTKELYLCGNCSAGFSSIQECKDHMLADHGQYAEEHETSGGLANEAKVDACTQVEPKKKPGRKRKSEVRDSPESSKEEVISDSGSDEDWSEKLNVDYSHSQRSKRRRRPPAALKNDYYLGKKGKSGMVARHPVSYSVPVREKMAIKCSLKGCTAKFKTNDVMKKHLECHIVGAPESEPAFKCLSCSEKFFFWKQARFHMWKIHKIDLDLISCEVCDDFKTDAPSKLKAHMEVHGSDRPYVCNICSKGFKQLAQMKNHQVIHKDELDIKHVEGKWYSAQPCTICGRVFANSKCLKKHVEIVHGKQKPFKCSFCNHTCSRKAMMDLHLRIHTQEKPFKCDSCSYASGDHNSLRRHKMRHSGQRPYKCPHCPYACIQAISLKIHIKNKHPGQEGVYLCHLCLFKTLNKTLFQNHLQDHKNGFIETLDSTALSQRTVRPRKQKPVIKPHISSISVHPNLLQQLQNQNTQPPSQIITLQATNIDSANSQPQIIQLPSNPQVMQVEMQVQTNEAGENIVSQEELAKLSNYEGLVQSDVAAAQLIFSALNAISQNAQQTDANEGAVVQEILETKGDGQTSETTNGEECVTHTITFHLPENGDPAREETVSEQQGVTLVEVTEGVDGVELAQQIQSGILVAGQTSAAEYVS